jgi:dihydroxyacetone kinase
LGEGALDVVVAGEVFASPSASQILAAMHMVRSSKGCVSRNEYISDVNADIKTEP